MRSKVPRVKLSWRRRRGGKPKPRPRRRSGLRTPRPRGGVRPRQAPKSRGMKLGAERSRQLRGKRTRARRWSKLRPLWTPSLKRCEENWPKQGRRLRLKKRRPKPGKRRTKRLLRLSVQMARPELRLVKPKRARRRSRRGRWIGKERTPIKVPSTKRSCSRRRERPSSLRWQRRQRSGYERRHDWRPKKKRFWGRALEKRRGLRSKRGNSKKKEVPRQSK
mmetsp:Transcript_6806/g.15625  ORF Transcript_6806/g.15625 Transcript_6806/m.15625 type:complete len:220 (-) Transcript_6806:186-845(-)